MKKFMVLMVALVATAAFVAPAFADHKLGGYYRNQFISEDMSFGGDSNTSSYIDQRLRMKWTNTLNENVKVVWYGEVDTVWGEQSKGSIGGGGMVGADGVNLETKNAYLELKVPNTPLKLTSGIQGFGGQFEGVLFNNDMAALKLDADFGGPTGTLFASKWVEGDRSKDDDWNVYAIQVNKLGPVGLGVYYYDDNTANELEVLSGGATLDLKITDMVGLDGFLLYQTTSSSADPSDPLVEGSAYAGTVRAKVNGIGNFRVLYFSKDDDATDRNRFTSPGGGAFEFYGDNSMIFLTDIYYNNGDGGRKALTDAAYAGYGLLGVNYAGKFTFGDDYYVKAGAGYYQALDDSRDNEAVASRAGSSLGFEVDGMVGRKIAEKVDISLRAAYAGLGDFYDGTAAGGVDPENPWKVIAMINVPY